jgi:hypothetical protein
MARWSSSVMLMTETKSNAQNCPICGSGNDCCKRRTKSAAGSLGCSDVPGHFVKRFSLGVRLASDNRLMFCKSDGALLFVPNRWPLLFREDGPGKPVHVQAEVMQPAQKNIRAHGPVAKNGEENISIRFDNDSFPKESERFVFHNAFPANLIGTAFCFNQSINRVAPGPGCDAGIRPRQIRLGNV